MSFIPEKSDASFYDSEPAECSLIDSILASVKLVANYSAERVNDFTVKMVNDAVDGAETQIWVAETATAVGSLVIHKAATSTVAKILAAAGGVTAAAVAWATLSAIGTGAVADEIATATPIRELPNFKGGYLKNQYK